MFKELFNYHSRSFLAKDLYEDNQNKNDKIVKCMKESSINLRNDINSKEILEKSSQYC